MPRILQGLYQIRPFARTSGNKLVPLLPKASNSRWVPSDRLLLDGDCPAPESQGLSVVLWDRTSTQGLGRTHHPRSLSLSPRCRHQTLLWIWKTTLTFLKNHGTLMTQNHPKPPWSTAKTAGCCRAAGINFHLQHDLRCSFQVTACQWCSSGDSHTGIEEVGILLSTSDDI